MTYIEYLVGAGRYHHDHLDQRYGQALFNYLAEVNPALAEKIRGTDNDPFHKTAHQLTDPLNYIYKNWKGQ